MKYIGGAAHEAVDAAQRLRGAYRRRKFRGKSEGSVLTAIDDPLTAAAAMMVSVASLEGPLSSQTEAVIRENLGVIAAGHDIEEEFVFARWVSDKVVDPNNMSTKFASLWTSKLTPDERVHLVEMVHTAASADGPASPSQLAAIARLRDRLGIERH
jgi:uncharacterized tellurite resistance protein B-like protein